LKRVLIISYYWPPSGGISVLRSLKITKYLRDFGWEPIIYKPTNAHYPYLDENNLDDIPDDITILERPIIEPFKLFKKLTGRTSSDSLNNIATIKDHKSTWKDHVGMWIRGNFFIPDARFLWIKPSVRYLLKYLRNHPVDAIFTDGPPHTNTYIGYQVSKKTGIPWLADFQDPWTQVDYYQLLHIGTMADRIHRKMEQRCFDQARKITIASPSWKEDLESIGATNVDVIYYGYDEDDFKSLRSNATSEFQIVHIGLLGKDRDPSGALSKIAADYNLPIKLVLAGQVDEDVLHHLQAIQGLTLEYKGIMKRREALQLAMDANILLLPLNKAENAKGRLPGKLYEYLRCYQPILALGPVNSDAAKIISETSTGITYEYHEAENIAKWIHSIAKKRLKVTPSQQDISAFSNRAQTGKIAHYLNEISE
jgi:glycosyltransferase involved in cell wall biosynthesis